MKTAAKVGVAALSAAATGVVALTKASVANYAEYEQLVGGVETLFKKSSDTVMKYAENAYKTAGLSANEYMETVTSFSASLLQSLGGDTEKAAKAADQAITDMSDNANKMGTSMEMIQNAYQGFAKQNYTMLDNLKLGYGGTKEEMERLLQDAEKLSGQKFDISSYADIVEAIHVVQTEMGITGTTAKEAATTISGSAGMMKAAWQNFMTGIADDNADFSTLTNNLVSSVSTFASNIIPRVQTALGGVGELVVQLLPVITDGLGNMLNTVVPDLINVAGEVINTLVVAFSENAPYLIQSAIELLFVLGDGLIQNAPILIDAVLGMIDSLAIWLGEYSLGLSDGVIALVVAIATMLVDNLPQLIPSIILMITEIVRVLTDPENLAALLDAALAIILAIAEGLIQSVPNLIVACLNILDNIVSFFTDEEQKQKVKDTAWELGKRLVEGLWEGVKAMAGWLKEKLFGWFDGLIGDVKEDQEIHSPSRKWARVLGKPMGQGVGVGAVEGLEDAERLIQREMDGMTASISTDINSSRTKKTPANETNELLTNLINLFESGKAKTSVSNAREMRGVSYG